MGRQKNLFVRPRVPGSRLTQPGPGRKLHQPGGPTDFFCLPFPPDDVSKIQLPKRCNFVIFGLPTKFKRTI